MLEGMICLCRAESFEGCYLGEDSTFHTGIFWVDVQSQEQLQSGLFFNIVVAERASIIELRSRKYKTLLIRWYTLFVLDFSFDVFYGV